RRLFAVVVGHRELARLRFQTVDGVETDLDAQRNECAVAAMHTGAQRDPLLRRFGARRHRASAHQRSEDNHRHDRSHELTEPGRGYDLLCPTSYLIRPRYEGPERGMWAGHVPGSNTADRIRN